MTAIRTVAAGLLLLLAGCGENQSSDTRILIGATTVTAPGAAPIEGSVIVVVGDKIRAVGLQKDVPIPQDSRRFDLAGKWVLPKEGGRLAPGEQANLVVHDHDASGTISREMTDGQWKP